MVGGDRCEESSDEGQADSEDGVASQLSVHALADLMEVFGRHSWWLLFCSFECLRSGGWRREEGRGLWERKKGKEERKKRQRDKNNKGKGGPNHALSLIFFRFFILGQG